jgi:hypothetical protein
VQLERMRKCKDTKLIVVMPDRGGQLVKQERDFLAELKCAHRQHKSMMGESASFSVSTGGRLSKGTLTSDNMV